MSKIFKKIDYKGKYFVLQDEVYEDGFEYEIGEMKEEDITDSFLREHVSICNYYGVPPYDGGDGKLNNRIDKLTEELINHDENRETC